jgi:hypothetical protein
MPGMPTKCRIKSWGLAESNSWDLLKCKMYLEKTEKRNKHLLLGKKVVLDVYEDPGNKYHHIYCDSFFPYTEWIKMLLEKTYACGTA